TKFYLSLSSFAVGRLIIHTILSGVWIHNDAVGSERYMSNTTEIKTRFMERLRTIKSYGEAVVRLHWYQRTGAPKKCVAKRSKTVGLLHTEAHKLTVSDVMGKMLEALAQPDVFTGLSEIEQRAVETMKLQYDRSRKIPTDHF